MSKKSDGPTGRVVIDERGRSVWRTPLNTDQVKALSTQLSLEGEAPPLGANPAGKRRTLDDMRQLSEEIKKNRLRK